MHFILLVIAVAMTVTILPHTVSSFSGLSRAKKINALLHSSSARNDRGDSGDLFFDQVLDHFNPQDRRTFKQRYFENTTFFEPLNGPVFLYICGEATCGGIPYDYSHVLAKQSNAAIVSIEHRYYGLSSPFELLSVPNLKFLSSRQAINDLAHFHTIYQEEINQKYNRAGLPDNKWITIGVSYSGALSAWYRLKFPHLSVGSLASSGVVEATLEFPEFDEQVQHSVGSLCSKALNSATLAIEAALVNDNKGTKAKFNAAGLNDGDFLFLIADSAALTVQYGHQDLVCNPIISAYNASGDLVAAMADFAINTFYPIYGVAPLTYGQEYLKLELSGEESGPRQWFYQTCSELGYFQVAPSNFSIRSKQLTIQYFQSVCTNVFGDGFWPPIINATNEYYGAKNIQATNTVFSNGSQDPWQPVTLQNSSNPERIAQTAVCDNCGHGVDMRGCPQVNIYPLGSSAKCAPPTQVDGIRQLIADKFGEWLSN